MVIDPQADWFVGGGDDTDPDQTKRAEEIAQECSAHFEDATWPLCWHWPSGKTLVEAQAEGTAHQEKQRLWSGELARIYSTFGIMQPTGDRWGADEPWAKALFPDAPAYIDRICGSPWIGREFARRMNEGAGPFHPAYRHMFADEELQCVAKRLGVLWQPSGPDAHAR